MTRYFKIIILATVLCLVPAVGWGTTYYVDCDVGASGDGSSWAQAFKTIGEGENAAQNAGDTVYISGGTYAESIDCSAFAGSSNNPITFEGSSEPGHSDEVIIDPNNADGLFLGEDYVDWKNVVFKNIEAGSIGIYLTGDNCTFENVKVQDADRLLYLEHAISCVFKKSDFQGINGAQPYGIDGTNLNNITFQYCRFRASENYSNKPIRLQGNAGTTYDFYNCILSGSGSEAIYQADANVTTNMKNCIVAGNQTLGGSHFTINKIAGTLNLFNSLWLPNWKYSTYGLNGVSESDNISIMPNFISSRYLSYFSITIDDYNLDYAEAVAALAESYGWRITFFVQITGIIGKENYTSRLQALVAAGHEIGSHSYSHPHLTNLNALEIQYTGAGATCVMTINASNLTIDSANDGDDLGPLDLTNASYDTLGKLCKYLNNESNYTCIRNSDTSARTLSSALADFADQDIKTAAYTAQLDQTRFFEDEITDSKTWFENTIGGGYVCKTFSYPYSDQNEAVQDAVKAAGYIGARAAGSETLSNLEIFDTECRGYEKGNGTEATIKKNASGTFYDMAERGTFNSLLTHTETDYTTVQLGYVLDIAMEIPGLVVDTFGNHCNEIRTSEDWIDADGDGERWTRTLIDNSDYHLQSSSPCIDAGTDVSLTKDFEGNPVPWGIHPDIGAYEYGYECKGDFDCDGDVDDDDLAVFAFELGQMPCVGDCRGDFDSDGDVDGADLSSFAAQYGKDDCPVCP